MYASHEVLGWYTFSSTDAPPGDDAWAIQDEITAYNESPLLLHLQTQGADPAGRLLLHVYTAGTRDKKPTFITAPYTIVTDDVTCPGAGLRPSSDVSRRRSACRSTSWRTSRGAAGRTPVRARARCSPPMGANADTGVPLQWPPTCGRWRSRCR